MSEDIIVKDLSLPYGVYLTCVEMYGSRICYGSYGAYDIKVEENGEFRITNSLDESTQWVSYNKALKSIKSNDSRLYKNRIKESIKSNIKDIAE